MAPKSTKKSVAASVATPAPTPEKVKKPKASGNSIDDAISMLQSIKIGDRASEVDKALTILEKVKKTMVTRKERKPRPPTEFNKFVSEKMKVLKDSGLSTNERMKECARLWKVQKALKA